MPIGIPGCRAGLPFNNGCLRSVRAGNLAAASARLAPAPLDYQSCVELLRSTPRPSALPPPGPGPHPRPPILQHIAISVMPSNQARTLHAQGRPRDHAGPHHAPHTDR
jgi:hypothetical protein